MVFQENRLISSLSIKDNILYPLRLKGYSEKVIKESYQKIIEKLKIEGDLSLSGDKISGGEKQKVAIARALIHDPDFIIADEPTGNLDREYTQEIGDILIDSNKAGKTIILITHDIHLLNYIKSKAEVNIFQM
ncbi:MAG: ATP-binding cassette domain-containing protein [Patescibacteria group bacterium]|nr:ATP-binding cassette domain-containing protein [Patescibacteria group bacterium]